MRPLRRIVAILVLAVLPSSASALTFGSAASLTKARWGQASTVLASGKVLVAGGVDVDAGGSFGVPVPGAELYDPATNTWAGGGTLTTPRLRPTATLLASGKVLVTSGFVGSLASGTDTAELYDPATNAWTSAGTMSAVRSSASATLLPGGKVLVVGGSTSSAAGDLYDPGTNSWTTTTMPMAETRQFATATLLQSGKVLVVSGAGGGIARTSAELYDPLAGTWSGGGTLTTGRLLAQATLLPSGKVLVTGGQNNSGEPLASNELYDPTTNAWTPAADGTARTDHQALLQADGTVLVLGGSAGSSTLTRLDAYDPTTNTWNPAGVLTTARSGFSVSQLTGGKILAVAGRNVNANELKTTEISPPLPTATPTSTIAATATPTATVPAATPTATATVPTTPSPTPPPATAPKVSGAKVKPKTLKTAKQRKKAKLTFTLSAPAAVTATVQRKVKKAFKTVRTLKVAGTTGVNRAKLKAKKFKPGTYRVRLAATNAAGMGSATAKFKVRPGPRRR